MDDINIVSEINDDDNGGTKPKKGKEEENCAIDFIGHSMESSLNFKMDDVEVGARDVVAVEIKCPNTGRFIFRYKEIVILAFDKCEYCYSMKPLIIECTCQEVMYCSQSCMDKDSKFHVEKCKNAYQVEEDFKIERKSNARMGLTGL